MRLFLCLPVKKLTLIPSVVDAAVKQTLRTNINVGKRKAIKPSFTLQVQKELAF